MEHVQSPPWHYFPILSWRPTPFAWGFRTYNAEFRGAVPLNMPEDFYTVGGAGPSVAQHTVYARRRGDRAAAPNILNEALFSAGFACRLRVLARSQAPSPGSDLRWRPLSNRASPL